jgi:hypothetical protein
LLLALLGSGQAQVPTFSADVRVVGLLATVRDRSGGIVKNLTKDDFRLEEDGRRQTIGYFSRETDLPLTGGDGLILAIYSSGGTVRTWGYCWARVGSRHIRH